MIKIKMLTRSAKQQKQDIEQAIKVMLVENKIVISQARTAKEICSTRNYNRSVESPLCGTGKLRDSVY